jgi:hypothetical protein
MGSVSVLSPDRTHESDIGGSVPTVNGIGLVGTLSVCASSMKNVFDSGTIGWVEIWPGYMLSMENTDRWNDYGSISTEHPR